VIEASAPGSSACIDATTGLAVALAAQSEKQQGVHEAIKILLALEKEVPADAPFDTRLQLVKALQLAGSFSRQNPADTRINSKHGSYRMPVRNVRGKSRTPSEREQLTIRTAELLSKLLAEQPDNLQAQLLRVELLGASRTSAVARILSPDGKTAMQWLDDILKQNPDSAEAKLLYVRTVAISRPSGAATQTTPDYAKASAYAHSLLADNPADSELIMMYLTVRDNYAMQLEQCGKNQEAKQENDKTLAILSFLTERADFTPEIREKLVMLVAMRSAHGKDRSQQEEEIRTLLQNYDAERIKDLQERMKRMREISPSDRRRPRVAPGLRRN
jgi:hypothetical protein